NHRSRLKISAGRKPTNCFARYAVATLDRKPIIARGLHVSGIHELRWHTVEVAPSKIVPRVQTGIAQQRDQTWSDAPRGRGSRQEILHRLRSSMAKTELVEDVVYIDHIHRETESLSIGLQPARALEQRAVRHYNHLRTARRIAKI